jgi:hypothetical protein
VKPITAAAIATLWLAAPSAKAEDAKPATGPGVPGLGEIMSLQQMRHIKLWFAGRAGNWPLADYEIDELKEGFDDVTKLVGPEVVKQNMGAPMAALQKAIDAKDNAAFTTAFDQLTVGCNACHRALGHAFIAIRRPTELPYSNQTFAPQK